MGRRSARGSWLGVIASLLAASAPACKGERVGGALDAGAEAVPDAGAGERAGDGAVDRGDEGAEAAGEEPEVAAPDRPAEPPADVSVGEAGEPPREASLEPAEPPAESPKPDAADVPPDAPSDPAAAEQAAAEQEPEAAAESGAPDAPSDSAAVMWLTISPTGGSLTSRNGSTPSLTFTVKAFFADGTSGPVPATFSVDTEAAGTIDPSSGVFTANGISGGIVEVTGQALGLTVSTGLTVSLFLEDSEPGTPSTAAQSFAAVSPVSDPTRAATILYPESDTLFPAHMLPPDIQWEERGSTGDLYRVTLTWPFARWIHYLAWSNAGFGYAFRPAAAAWANLIKGAGSAPVSVEVDRFDAAAKQVVTGNAITFQFAPDDLAGAIYYWASLPGKVVRITPGVEASAPFFTPPPSPDDGDRCFGCHTVSADGRKMAFEYWGADQWGGIVDLTAPSAPQVGPSTYRANFQTFDPTGTRLLVNYAFALKLVDAATGAEIPAAGLPDGSSVRASQPAWSPSGDAVVWARVPPGAGAYELDFSASDLVRQSVSGTTFAPPAVLVPSGGAALCYPAYTPDGAFLAFGRSPFSRSSETGSVPLTWGEIWAVSPGGGSARELKRLNLGHMAYKPTFGPSASAEHSWIAFFSRRDYGNSFTGTRGTTRRQIWVAAVDADVLGGADPSHPAFWLPGQDVAVDNISPSWAPSAP